jgi:exopolysaccharide production protein ExoQ
VKTYTVNTPPFPLPLEARSPAHRSQRLVLPGHADLLDWLICFISLSMLLFSYSTLFPGGTQMVLLLFMAPWAIILLRQPSHAFLSIIRNWVLVLLPLLALVSILWSEYPNVTLRIGLEYLATTLIGIWAACCIKPSITISALMSALILGIVFSIFIAPHDNIGIFGSKNYYALCISFLMLTAITVVLDKSEPLVFRLIGFAAFALSPPELLFVQSVGALVDTCATLGMFFALRAASQLHLRIRSLALLIIFVFGTSVFLLGVSSINSSDVLGFVGKDATLTGRTLIWQHGFDSIASHPVAGVGYAAFWQGGNWSAEQIWRFMHIPGKSGFHFHDIYLQIAVDLGVIGLLVFIVTLLVLIFRAVGVICRPSVKGEQWFAVNILIFLLLRSPIEVDLFFPFNLPSVLICFVWVYLPPIRFRRKHTLPLRRKFATTPNGQHPLARLFEVPDLPESSAAVR